MTESILICRGVYEDLDDSFKNRARIHATLFIEDWYKHESDDREVPEDISGEVSDFLRDHIFDFYEDECGRILTVSEGRY